mgnify:CR=1 FL=1
MKLSLYEMSQDAIRKECAEAKPVQLRQTIKATGRNSQGVRRGEG